MFGLGELIIVVSLNLETVFSCYWRRYKQSLYQQVRWRLDSTLQLQRMAFEEAGFSEWKGGANKIPTTVVNNVQIQVSTIFPSRRDGSPSFGYHPVLFEARVCPTSFTLT
jgi:hypothetical protein